MKRMYEDERKNENELWMEEKKKEIIHMKASMAGRAFDDDGMSMGGGDMDDLGIASSMHDGRGLAPPSRSQHPIQSESYRSGSGVR
jgi:hypothetical protein